MHFGQVSRLAYGLCFVLVNWPSSSCLNSPHTVRSESTPDCHRWIIGFWLTQLAGNRTLLGKKGYAPEEQLRQGNVFPCSDLYSLAVTVLVLLTGKEPQDLYDSYQATWRWGQEIKVGSKLEAVLKKMLADKPNDRYQKADEVLKDLQSSSPIKLVNSQITKIKTLVVAPGRQRVNAVASQLQSKTQIIARSATLPAWLRSFALSLIGSSVVILTFAGTWMLVTAALHSVSFLPEPKISASGSPSPSKPSNNQDTSRISQILSRRQQLEIPNGFFNLTVNDIFYTKNPSARGRSLTSSPEDTALRNEWVSIADEVLNKLEQANLSTETRRKLGSYSSRDYNFWKQQAQAGRLGKYTINQLYTDTNQKFDQLFPGQQHGKLNKQTFAQIWYAIGFSLYTKNLGDSRHN